MYSLFICFPSPLFFAVRAVKSYSGNDGKHLQLQGDKLSGTCFMVTKDGKQYFVTAAHLFEPFHKSGDQVPIQILIQNQLQSFNANVFFHPDINVDIAVVKLSEKISQSIELPEEFIRYNELLQKVFQGRGITLDSTLIAFGMEVFFYGFPLGNLGTEALGIKFPLLKKAIVSGLLKHNGVDVLVLYGHNNLGFSEGPVVVYDISSKKMCIVSVISGYIPEPIDVQHKGERLSVNENSGIIVCDGRRYIEEIFTKNKKDLR